MDESSQTLTVGVFKEILATELKAGLDALEARTDRKFERLESKMMEGFDALDKKIDFVDANLSGRIDKVEIELKSVKTGADRQYRALTSQIQHLALTKADWPHESA